MSNLHQTINAAIEKDAVLQLKIRNAVKAAVEKELIDANIIKAGDLNDQNVGCVNTVWTLVCTC
ncbi:MAG: hypothetical protein Q8900_02305 [Bacillota bacterium]|nr:hypothetical protein [Bacillota bacterium]